jgi:thioester reductase-like protein
MTALAQVTPRAGDGVLITGATGFLGMELMARYLERTDRPVYALIRAPDQKAANGRLRDTLTTVFGQPGAHDGRTHAVRGDVEKPDLGLDESTQRDLASRVTDIVHSAASVSFTEPLPVMRGINVEGTRRVLDFAERCRDRGGLHRFSHISTAFVAGTQEGDFRESVLDCGQSFHNPYEQSKFEAEKLVRERRGRLPVRVMRPSIIVGERGSGWTTSFNVLYGPLKGFARDGLTALLPADPAAPVDVVPVDYVADAVFSLANEPPCRAETPDTYHLVAGRHATTVGRLVTMSARFFGRREPIVIPMSMYQRVLHPMLMRSMRGARRRALRRSEVFFPYFASRTRFDDAQARAHLESAGLRVTPIERYYDRLLDFAVDTDFGRRRVGRIEARRRGLVRRGRAVLAKDRPVRRPRTG